MTLHLFRRPAYDDIAACVRMPDLSEAHFHEGTPHPYSTELLNGVAAYYLHGTAYGHKLSLLVPRGPAEIELHQL